MIEAIFKYTFLQNAFLTALFASVVCGIVGTIIVEKKLVSFSGGIAHASFGGIGLGYLLGFEPIFGGIGFAVLSAFGVAQIRKRSNTNEDTLISMLWAAGMALGILFIALTPGYPPDMTSYLFGDILTVNGHSYADSARHTENTNFALLVSNHFTKPFKDSNEYGASIARLSNMLGGGVLVQRFGDLERGRRSNEHRMRQCDLSLVIPKRQLDGIIDMIYALDKIAPGTANEDTLLYGVEVKFYNCRVAVDEHLETSVKGLYVLGDTSGVTHSLAQAAASGLFVARELIEQKGESFE